MSLFFILCLYVLFSFMMSRRVRCSGVELGAWGRRRWKNGNAFKGYVHGFGQQALEGDVKILAGPRGKSLGRRCLFFASLGQTESVTELLPIQLCSLINCMFGSAGVCGAGVTCAGEWVSKAPTSQLSMKPKQFIDYICVTGSVRSDLLP